MDWNEGVTLAGLGLLGALVLLYVYSGEHLPGMGGGARLTVLEAEIDDLKRLKQESLKRRRSIIDAYGQLDDARIGAEQALTKDLELELSRREASTSAERRSTLRFAVPLYAVIGALLASAVATNLLQALLVGFGWTAVASRIGLRRDEPERKAILDEKSAELLAENERLRTDAANQKVVKVVQEQRIHDLDETIKSLTNKVAELVSRNADRAGTITNG